MAQQDLAADSARIVQRDDRLDGQYELAEGIAVAQFRKHRQFGRLALDQRARIALDDELVAALALGVEAGAVGAGDQCLLAESPARSGTARRSP